MIWVSITTGPAISAPVHLFGTYRFTFLESLIVSLINGIFSNFHYFTSKFMANGSRKCSKSRVENITVIICLKHVHISATNSHAPNLNQNFIVSYFRNFFFFNPKLRIVPNHASKVSQLTIDIFCP